MTLENLVKILNDKLEEGFPWNAEVFAISKESDQKFSNLETITFSIMVNDENKKESNVVLRFKDKF